MLPRYYLDYATSRLPRNQPQPLQHTGAHSYLDQTPPSGSNEVSIQLQSITQVGRKLVVQGLAAATCPQTAVVHYDVHDGELQSLQDRKLCGAAGRHTKAQKESGTGLRRTSGVSRAADPPKPLAANADPVKRPTMACNVLC